MAEREMFVSDIHGEYQTFSHLLRSGAGSIADVIKKLYQQPLDKEERAELATLIYYPEEKIAEAMSMFENADMWLNVRIGQLMYILAVIAYEHGVDSENIVSEAGETDDAASYLAGICKAIQNIARGNVHMVGDVYDRGPAPDLAMDAMEKIDNLDIQWGNHDILWMGAALGQRGSICNAVRICARYGNLSILEDTYNMDLSVLKDFAMTTYADDPCVAFGLKGSPEISDEEREVSIKVQKAMSYIQFKVESQIIADNPSYGLEKRNLLHHIDYEAGTVELDGVVHELTDKVFPTIDPADPYRLTPEEEKVVESLEAAFTGNERLQRHMDLFLQKGSLYKICGDTLLFHACVPLNPDGSLKEVELFGQKLKGRALFDAVDGYVRDAYKATDPAERKRGLDMLWYLWLGEGSPLFAKSKMATFELYLVTDKDARKEVKNPFYSLYEDAAVIDGIFKDFGMDPATSRIVCGHVPVKVKDGENPAKCGGRVVIIDGGMSPAYQSTTGIAGFVMVKDDKATKLGSIEKFCGTEQAIAENKDLVIEWREL